MMRNAILWRRILSCALVGAASTIAALASCTEGSAPPGPARRAAVADAGSGSGTVDASPVVDAGSGSDGGTVDASPIVDAGSGSDGGTGPTIAVAPTSLHAGSVEIGAGMFADSTFTIMNTGTSAVMFGITLPSGPFSAPGVPCIEPTPTRCVVAPGASFPVAVRFIPTLPGVSAGSITIASNAAGSPHTVDIDGNGLGSRAVVIDPADHAIDFGTIPRNSTASRPIVVAAIGNKMISVGATGPGAPFAVTPPMIAIPPGGSNMFTASCGSPTATGPVNLAIALSRMTAYEIDPLSIDVRCEIANTQVTVDPNQFDFDETRKGAAMAPSRSFTISNQGPVPATIKSVELTGAPASLSMTLLGGVILPRTLATGDSITGRMSLTTDEDIDLGRSSPKLRIGVDDEQLVYPVTGKITTPAAYVTPEKLELGTACVGSDVTAMISMVNSGTARLTIERPQLESQTGSSFTLQPQSPPTYPAPLLAGMTATVGVSPAADSPGARSGTLTWAVDAPRSPFVIPASLEFIETGTAISPASLNFSTVKVDEISIRYLVVLQNCNTVPVLVTVDGVTASRGGTAAWKVEPSQDSRTLAPQDKLTIGVAFAPRRHGHHVAQLRLGVDGDTRTVTLEGDGIDLDFKRTSFYACGCTTPSARAGWPIALAVALALRRRRRPRRA